MTKNNKSTKAEKGPEHMKVGSKKVCKCGGSMLFTNLGTWRCEFDKRRAKWAKERMLT